MYDSYDNSNNTDGVEEGEGVEDEELEGEGVERDAIEQWCQIFGTPRRKKVIICNIYCENNNNINILNFCFTVCNPSFIGFRVCASLNVTSTCRAPAPT